MAEVVDGKCSDFPFHEVPSGHRDGIFFSSASKTAGDGIATCDWRDMCLFLSLKVF